MSATATRSMGRIIGSTPSNRGVAGLRGVPKMAEKDGVNAMAQASVRAPFRPPAGQPPRARSDHRPGRGRRGLCRDHGRGRRARGPGLRDRRRAARRGAGLGALLLLRLRVGGRADAGQARDEASAWCGMDGRPAGMREIALRTVLRLVDGLFFYLVGLIVMIATGERRGRLGDLVGGTMIVAADAAGPRGRTDAGRRGPRGAADPDRGVRAGVRGGDAGCGAGARSGAGGRGAGG